MIFKTGKEFNLKYDWSTWISNDDIAFGIQLYSAIHYCPDHLMEAAKLFHFFENLIHNHSLNTVVAATIKTIQPMASDSIKDFASVNMWYDILDKRYNLTLGPVITPLLTSGYLEKLASLEAPFLKRVDTNEKSAYLVYGKTILNDFTLSI